MDDKLNPRRRLIKNTMLEVLSVVLIIVSIAFVVLTVKLIKAENAPSTSIYNYEVCNGDCHRVYELEHKVDVPDNEKVDMPISKLRSHYTSGIDRARTGLPGDENWYIEWLRAADKNIPDDADYSDMIGYAAVVDYSLPLESECRLDYIKLPDSGFEEFSQYRRYSDYFYSNLVRIKSFNSELMLCAMSD